jgi:hypothetical protein
MEAARPEWHRDCVSTAFKERPMPSGSVIDAGHEPRPWKWLTTIRNWMRSNQSDAPARPCLQSTEERVDEALEETFPASDPPAFMGGVSRGNRSDSRTRT